MKSLSHVRLLATPWTAAYQASLSTVFSRLVYLSELPLLSPLEGKAQIFFLLLFWWYSNMHHSPEGP